MQAEDRVRKDAPQLAFPRSTATEIGIILREMREERYMTQGKAAEATHLCRSHIGHFESGGRTSSMKFVQLLALLNAYGVSLTEFARRLSEAQELGGERV